MANVTENNSTNLSEQLMFHHDKTRYETGQKTFVKQRLGSSAPSAL